MSKLSARLNARMLMLEHKLKRVNISKVLLSLRYEYYSYITKIRHLVLFSSSLKKKKKKKKIDIRTLYNILYSVWYNWGVMIILIIW